MAKLLRDVNFCKILSFKFYLLLFCTFRMFVTFTYLFSFCCRCRSDIRVCELLPGFGSQWMVRGLHECFEKSLYGRNLLLTIQNFCFFSFHGTSDSPPMKGNFMLVCAARICRRFLRFAYVVVRVCMGKVYSLLVRGVSRSKTLNPLILSQSSWMLYYNNK